MNANDWSRRVVLMTPEFLYYSYQEAEMSDESEMRERSGGINGSAAGTALKLSDLHLAEP